MKRVNHSTALVIVALLLPGLALAAPIAGACGQCGEGEGCHLQQPVETSLETDSCCDSESENPPESSLGSSSCECGREAPPAVLVDASPSVETAVATTSVLNAVSPLALTGSRNSNSTRLAAPPPAPPAYLIDCAFLT